MPESRTARWYAARPLPRHRVPGVITPHRDQKAMSEPTPTVASKLRSRRLLLLLGASLMLAFCGLDIAQQNWRSARGTGGMAAMLLMIFTISLGWSAPTAGVGKRAVYWLLFSIVIGAGVWSVVDIVRR